MTARPLTAPEIAAVLGTTTRPLTLREIAEYACAAAGMPYSDAAYQRTRKLVHQMEADGHAAVVGRADRDSTRQGRSADLWLPIPDTMECVA